MTYPTDLRYSKDHEWIRASDDVAEIGITHFAQEQLGDVVYVDVPEVGRSLAPGEAFGSIESVKAASELFAPVGGTVIEVNEGLKAHPELVNSDPHATWMIKVRLSSPSGVAALMDSSQYERFVG